VKPLLEPSHSILISSTKIVNKRVDMLPPKTRIPQPKVRLPATQIEIEKMSDREAACSSGEKEGG
jgi:hypothetical protein